MATASVIATVTDHSHSVVKQLSNIKLTIEKSMSHAINSLSHTILGLVIALKCDEDSVE